MTIQEMINKYKFTSTTKEGNYAIRANCRMDKIAKEDIEFIKANLEEMKSAVKAIDVAKEEEQIAKEKATVRFFSTGWEVHEIAIDTRFDIDEQLKKIAEYYPEDCDFESLKKDFEKNKKDAAEKEIRTIEKTTKIAEIKETAKTTGIKQIIASWSESCIDKKEECSLDIVTKWAMPDGSEQTIRQHTW